MYTHTRLGVVLPGLAALAVQLAGFTLTAHAGPITFENLQAIPFTGSQSQGSFTYQVVSGTAWGLDHSVGHPPSALTTSSNGASQVGDEVDFFRTAGSVFTFSSFDFAAVTNASSDTVNFIGERNGVPIEHLLGVGASSSTFQTMLSGFSQPIDLLRVQIASIGSTRLALDNPDLTPVALPGGGDAVPEPSTLALFGLGGLALAVVRLRSGCRTDSSLRA
jgi:hypothetical protein